jgi:outer membrane receptor for ferrienterochelin and colicin
MHLRLASIDAKVVSTRGAMSISGAGCQVDVVIDGMPHQDINFVQPSDIGAMEVYRGPAGAPPQYDSACGVIVIWTKR